MNVKLAVVVAACVAAGCGSGSEAKGSPGPLSSAVWSSRVSPAGVVLDDPALELARGATEPAVCAYEGRVYAAWVERDRSQLSLVDPATGAHAWTRTTPVPGVVSQDAHSPTHHALSCGSSGAAVAWNEGGRVKIARFTRDGAEADGAGVVVGSGDVGAPGVGSDGAGYLVAWWERGADPPTDVLRAARVPATGQPLDPGGVVLKRYPSTDAGPVRAPARVLFDGTDFIVHGTYRVRADGSFIDQDPFSYDNAAISDGAVASATCFGDRIAVFLQTTSGDGVWPGVIEVPSSCLGFYDVPPVVASGAGTFLVVFQTLDHVARAVRVQPSGAVSDPTPIDIAEAAWRPPLVVAFDGTDFVTLFVRW